MPNPVLNKALTALRWVAVLPVAFVAAWAAGIVASLFGRFAITYFDVAPDSFYAQFFSTTVVYSTIGGSFVYTGVRFSPNYRDFAAYVLAFLGILTGGVALVQASLGDNGWAMWASVCGIAGISRTVYWIHQGELDLQ